MRAKALADFIRKRDEHRLVAHEGAKWIGVCKPDPIISRYRFCNMVRADDRVTKFIFRWAERWSGHKDLWFAFVVARLFNQPDTLAEVAGCTLPTFRPEKMRGVLHARRDADLKNFNAAYIVSTNGIAMDKVDYVIDRVLLPLWERRTRYRPKNGETLSDYHARLCGAQGLGSFMAAQVIADLKYFPPFMSEIGDAEHPLPTQFAPDWWTFAASGPGSRRGLNRVMHRPIKAGWKEGVWRATLAELITKVRPLLPAKLGIRMSAQDYQNTLCEFDKYERARLGEGEPKQIYKPFNTKEK